MQEFWVMSSGFWFQFDLVYPVVPEGILGLKEFWVMSSGLSLTWCTQLCPKAPTNADIKPHAAAA